jgi:hypothetical protein
LFGEWLSPKVAKLASMTQRCSASITTMQRYIHDVLELTHSRANSVRWAALQLLVTFVRQGMGHPAEVCTGLQKDLIV